MAYDYVKRSACFMKKNRRILSVLLAAIMVFALAGCGGAEGKKESQKKVADDTAVLGMSFLAPEQFETVERSVEKTTEGKLISKVIMYTISDDCDVGFAYTDADGQNLEDEMKDLDIERKEYNGKELILYKSGKKNIMALYQEGEDVYAIQYRSSNEETISDELDKILQNVKITKEKTTTLNDFTLEGISYKVETDVPVYSESTSLKEKSDGTVVSKSFVWKYAKDSKKTDYRFGVELYKNMKVEEKLNEKKEYEDKKIGEVTYKVEKKEEETDIYDYYYTQQGEDVYVISNKGVSNGWFVSRSDESKEAFKTFINNVRFK